MVGESFGRNLGASDMACLICLLIDDHESPEYEELPIMSPTVFFTGGGGGVWLSHLSSLLSLCLSPLLLSSLYA